MIFNFRNWVLQTFPFLEDDFDALTDYELFCKMLEYVKKFAKDNEEFNKRLTDLENYINNLDLQDEVNNKLDEMAEDGTLENLISQYIQLQTTYNYDRLYYMKQATNLIDGSYAKTFGYYSYNDGGGAIYKIRNITNEDIVDDKFIVALNNPNLIAELIVKNNTLNVLQVGVKTNDISTQDEISYASSKGYNLYFPKGVYQLGANLVLENVNNTRMFGDGIDTVIKIKNNISGEWGAYIQAIEPENFTIENMKIDCGTQTNSKYVISLLNGNNLTLKNLEIANGHGYATRLNDSSNITIENLYIHDFKNLGDGTVSGGIYGQRMKNVYINNVVTKNIDDHAYYLTGDGDDATTQYAENIQISNCKCFNNGLDNSETASGALTIYGRISNVEVNNCYFYNCKEGIHITKHVATLNTPKNITINNCIIKNSINNAVYIEGLDSDLIESISFTNCIIDNSSNDGGLSVRKAKLISINGCVVKNCHTVGIEFVDTDNSIINNNLIYNNVNQIWIGARYNSTHSNNNIVSNNNIFNTLDFKPSNNSGLFVATNTINNVISNNNIYVNNNYNIRVLGSNNKVINQPCNNKNDTGNIVRSIYYSDTIPSTGTAGSYQVGDICYNKSPTAGGSIGWVCTTAGSPGTWKEFGTISN